MAAMNDKIYAIGVTSISLASGSTLVIPMAANCIKTEISNISGGTLILTGSGTSLSPSVSVANGRDISVSGLIVEGPSAYILGCSAGTAAFKLTRYFTQGS